MSKNLSIKPANSNQFRRSIFEIRRTVFVEEQNVPAAKEYDEFETSSHHLAALLNQKVVGTCRYRNTELGIKLERFAVLYDYRGHSVGDALINHCLVLLKNESYVYLNAQVQVVNFYSKYGFKKVGPQFEEAGILHFRMVWQK